MKISDEIVKQQFVQREYGLAHSTYDNELDFYQLVSSGDVKAAVSYTHLTLPTKRIV